MKYINLLLSVLISLITFSCIVEKETFPPVENNFDIKGADISFLPEVRKSGLVFYNADNKPEDMLLTLKNAGVNTVRIRLWVNPSEKNSNFNTVKGLADEARSLGFKILLTLHYSDTWADPAHQEKPLSWKNLSFTELKDSVNKYTKTVMQKIDPDFIQIGNEINFGFLWPEGHSSNLSQMKSLLSSAISAIRETDKATGIIIHYAGYTNAASFFNNLSDLDFDYAGLSYYPIWHGKNLDELQQAVHSLASFSGKKILITETAYPFTLEWNDWTNNIVGSKSQLIPSFPASPDGQKQYMVNLIQRLKTIKSYSGFCYWGGEWVSYKGNTAKDGSSWENQAFWDFKNNSLPILDVYKMSFE